MAISKCNCQWISVEQVTIVGGVKSQGIKIPSLKSSGDYALLVAKDDCVMVQSLNGKSKDAMDLKPNSWLEISDLKLFFAEQVLASSRKTSDPTNVLRTLENFVSKVTADKALEEKMSSLLSSMIELNDLEKGFVAIRSLEGHYKIIASSGVKADDPWLSESLLKQTLSSTTPLIVQNVIGSKFENNRSLMATGFLSVFSWPLLVQSECLGALVLGSTKPHNGLNETQKAASLLLSFLGAAFLQQILEVEKLSFELKSARQAQKYKEEPFLSQDARVHKLCEISRRVASTELAILIHGETGTGKEMLAQWLHQNSGMAKGPFVPINCGAIPENLVESTLFGHKRGSFTGAISDQPGKFQSAHKGTLFLDEIGDLPLSVQVKLLRALQEKVIEPVGGGKSVEVDVRVIAASHRDLTALVKRGDFREDLYFRLAEITLEIPPLRERTRDIALLVFEFLHKIGCEKRLSGGAWQWLQAQPWRGNVRELFSSVKRAMVLSSGAEITVQDFLTGLPPRTAEQTSWLGGKTLEEAVTNFQQGKVKLALDICEGNRTKAAEILGITPRTLFRYLEDFRETMTDLS